MLAETSKQQRQMAILASMISKEKLTFQVKMGFSLDMPAVPKN